MMKKIITLTLTLLLINCASDNEQKALDEIARIYIAKVSYSKGFSSALGKKKIKRFNIKTSNSKMLDTLPISETSANMALTVFKNFSEKEKNSYTEINTQFINSKKDTLAFRFPTSLMKILLPKTKGFTIFSEGIKNKTFKDIENFKNKTDFSQDIGKFLENYTKILNQNYGIIINYKLIGLAEVKYKERTFAQYIGYFIFSTGKYIKYSVNIDMTEGKDKIAGFRIFK